MKRTWKENASEFAKLDRGEGWPFALLVACSVEEGAGQGKADLGTTVPKFQKVSANKFAEQAGTSRPRVSRFLDAWHKAADEGLVRPASELTPDDALTEPLPDKPWKEHYSAPRDKTGGPNNADIATVKAKAAKNEEYARELRAAIAPTDPDEKRETFTRLAADDDVRDDHATRHAASQALGENSTVRRLKSSGHRKQQESDSTMQNHSFKQIIVQDHVSTAAQELTKAATELETTRITDTEIADLIREHVATIEAKLDLVKMSLDGTSEAVEEAIAKLGENNDGNI